LSDGDLEIGGYTMEAVEEGEKGSEEEPKK